METLQKEIDVAKALASGVDDPIRRQMILDSIEELNKVAPKIKPAIQSAVADFSNEAAKAQVIELFTVKSLSTL